MKIITRQTVLKKINIAENELLECYQLLKDFKNGNFTVLISFQPKLAICLYKLSVFYQELCKEHKEIISRKEKFTEQELKILLKNNSDFQKAIKAIIEIGKTLGDSYAYFFFNDNIDTLHKNLTHQNTGFFPTGIGGQGELQFIRNYQSLGGAYIIHHSITSMLKTGDFSLYQPDAGIIGYGEIKTEVVDGHLSLNIITSTNIDLEINESESLNLCSDVNDLVKKYPKLSKQLAIQEKLLKFKKSDFKKNLEIKFEHKLLNKLIENEIAINQDKNIILYGYRPYYNDSIERLMNDQNCEDETLPIELKSYVHEFIISNSKYNMVIMKKIDCNITHTRVPMFWWNIDSKLFQDILFGKLRVISLYNPAKLLDYYESKGFKVSFLNPKNFYLYKQINGNNVEFRDFNIINDLAMYSLMKFNNIIKLINDYFSGIESGRYPV